MCNRIKGIMISEDYKNGFTTLIRIRCEMWSCPDCGPINAYRWRAYLLDRFNKAFPFEKWVFGTITAKGSDHRKGAIATLTALQLGWKRLYDRLKRHYKKRVEYVRIFEQHKTGRFHMHFLLNVGEEYDKHNFVAENVKREFRHPECVWLRKACVELKLGWRVHLRRVWDSEKKTENVGLVVGYILKYMGKTMSLMQFPKYQHRIGTSREIGSPEKAAKGQGTWIHMRELPETALRATKPILDMSTGEVLTVASFEGEGYYPPLKYYRGGGSSMDQTT